MRPWQPIRLAMVAQQTLSKVHTMLAIRLPGAIEQRLAALASETGRTKTALAREAILEYIDDLEDCHLAEARAAQPQDHCARGRGARTWPVGWSSILRC